MNGTVGMDLPYPMSDLRQLVDTRAYRQIRNLKVEFEGRRVILRGETTSYHYKQLAQHGILDVLPGVRLDNRIVVA